MPWYAWVASGYVLVSLLVLLALAVSVLIAEARDAWQAGQRRQALSLALLIPWMVGLVVAWAVVAGWLPK